MGPLHFPLTLVAARLRQQQDRLLDGAAVGERFWSLLLLPLGLICGLRKRWMRVGFGIVEEFEELGFFAGCLERRGELACWAQEARACG